MTVDYSYVASYDVRKVLWSELQSTELIDPNNYYADGFLEPLIPIIPAQQVPEFNNLLPGKTYIVYDIQQRHTGEQWWMSEEVITLDIVSRNAQEIQTIINLITDLFRRYDLSAKTFKEILVPGSPFEYYFFRLESADPVQAFDHEGGFMNGVISIAYAYTRNLDMYTGRYS
jgi:hypothetical protein